MTRRSRHSGRSSRRELSAAVVLLAMLPAVVLALLAARDAGPQPATDTTPAADAPHDAHGLAEELVMQPQYARQGPGAVPAPVDLAALLPAPAKLSPFRITSPPRQWTAEKMHEKINGEDIIYIEAGCIALAAMTLSDGPGTETIDLYLFQMRTPEAAEKVFAAQAPSDNAADEADRPKYVDLGDKAYTAYASCYLRAGAFYLKILVSGESKAAADEATALARRFALKHKDRP